MDVIWEAILELVLEGTLELCSCKKVPKWIRYPLLVIVALLFGALTLGLIIGGIGLMDKSVVVGLLFSALGLFFLIAGTREIKKRCFP